MQYQSFIGEKSKSDSDKVEKLHKEALELLHNKRIVEAENKLKEVLRLDSNHAHACLNLGTLFYTSERYSEALEAILKSLEIDSSQALGHYTMGLILEKLGAIYKAIQAYQQAIHIDYQWIDAYNQLGHIYGEAGDFEKAESIYRKAIVVKPKHFGSYLNLGNILLEQEKIDEAITAYEKALELKPRDSNILYNMGVAFEAKKDYIEAALNYGYSFYRQGKYQEAIKEYQKVLETNNGDVFFYIALAECHKSLNEYEKAIIIYEQGLKNYPKSTIIYLNLINTLQHQGKIKEAISIVNKAYKLNLNLLSFQLEEQRLLPIIYEKEKDIEFYRERFIKSLKVLTHQTYLDTPEAKKSALEGIGYRTNFYLQYQGQNDTLLQKQYGDFVHQVMAISYPEWVKPLSKNIQSKNRKIRVGYVSHCLRIHTVGKLMLGWIKNHNYQEFETYCYYLDRNIDYLTQKFHLHSNHFHHIPEDFESVCKQIISDEIDILVILDIVMYAEMSKIAGLRLAPIQCTTWGHPITSGIPTVDYFLSSELMEPQNAQEHYSEKLICLPNIGVSYPKPVIPELTKKRSEFKLKEESIVYLSCQSLFKYLPQYDYIFAEIARQVPQAQFAFISHASLHITNIFRKRLQDAFAKFNLNSEDYCVISPRISWKDYCNLNQVSDIFLDTLSWSGGNTTLEAVACNLPIVTCPGEFMRGRHSYGILKMLGVTETIAKNETEYIDIAVKLGQDNNWRNNIVKRMIERHSYLYDDKSCIEALEKFYKSVVMES